MRFLKNSLLPLLAGLTINAHSIEIDLRYDYDTSGFFDQPGSKEAMRACADFFEQILADELAEINAATSGDNRNTWSAFPEHPSTGNRISIIDLIVPKDTIVIFLGARDLGAGNPNVNPTGIATTGASFSGVAGFNSTVSYRGQSGADATPATDYGPWGGSISFDTQDRNGSARSWNFSTTQADSSQANFVSVALHEILHLLGVGIADSWQAKAGDDLLFQGPASIAANDGSPPKLQEGRNHWGLSQTQSETFESFATPHGLNQRTLMSPQLIDRNGGHFTITDLDIAALIDIGWQVSLPATGEISVLDGEVIFKIPTTTDFTYRVQQGNLIDAFTNLGNPLSGDGSIQTLTTPVSASQRDFFRFVVSGNSAAARSPRRFAPMAPLEIVTGHSQSSTKACCHHE